MWWMLIPLSPDTLSVDERTDPPHMVLKKQSQTVSSRAYSQRNAYNAVSGSDRMLSREVTVGYGARLAWYSSLPAVAGHSVCLFPGLVALPGPQGARCHCSCLCQPLPAGPLARASRVSSSELAGVSAKEWVLCHKPFCSVLC